MCVTLPSGMRHLTALFYIDDIVVISLGATEISSAEIMTGKRLILASIRSSAFV
jgi:hypothetical protein